MKDKVNWKAVLFVIAIVSAAIYFKVSEPVPEILPTAELGQTPGTALVNEVVTLSAKGSISYDDRYTWVINQNLYKTTTEEPYFRYTFENIGIYEIQLTVDGKVTVKRNIIIYRVESFEGSIKSGDVNDSFNLDSYRNITSMTIYLRYPDKETGEYNDLDIYLYDEDGKPLMNSSEQLRKSKNTQEEILRIESVTIGVYKMEIEFMTGPSNIEYTIEIKQFK